MREQVFLLFVLNLMRSSVGNIPRKSCSVCTAFQFCNAAGILLNEKESAANNKLKEAFCGFDNDNKPMVCCSELSSAELTSTMPGSDSIESHPNLRLLSDECGAIKENKLLGGRTGGLYDYPWNVLIAYKTRSGLQFQCGGSLINERYVLTAAHCISNLTLGGVRVGEFDVTTATDCKGEPPRLICETNIQDLHIEEAIVHPDYHVKPNLVKNDIGVLRLKKPVNFTFENAGTICLPVTKGLQDRNMGGLMAIVAGWGFSKSETYDTRDYVSSQLLAVEVPIHTHETCSQMYNISNPLRGGDDLVNKLCAGEKSRGTCNGDSGGPLIVRGVYKNQRRFIQYGILSYRPLFCGNDVPSIYTDVSKYVKWILDNLKP